MKLVKRVGVEAVGWALLLLGVAALVLPGPGLLMVFAGMAVLSQRYEWAERRLAPVKYRALKGAAQGVASTGAIIASITGIVLLFAAGALWIAQPPVPGWWPLSDGWWLPGGLATATTQIASGVIAVALLVYSYRRFHGKPEAVRALEGRIDEADREYDELTADD